MPWIRSLIVTIAAASIFAGAAAAEEWPNWRGPHYDGSTQETNLPVQFSRTENLKWVAEMPGPSAATPVIWGDRVFVSSTDPKAQELLAICLDRKTGKILWQNHAGSGYQPPGAMSKIQYESNSNYASPSPVTDGKRVFFFFGNGDLVAFDMNGQKLWARNIQRDLGDFCYMWTFSSSPQLYDGKLYLQVLQRDQAVGEKGKDGAESFLLAMDPATGKELWRQVRPSPAKMESREAYSTPIPFEQNGRKEILVAGGDVLTGHDPATGKELWRWGTWNSGHRETWWRLVPTPVPGGGVVVVCAPKRAPAYAVKTGGTGTLDETDLAWKSDDRGPVSSDVPTPLFYHGKFYVLSDVRKSLSCVDPATGKMEWTIPTPGPVPCWGSPTGADGKIYILSLRGEVLIVDPASGKILATNPLAQDENDIRSSVAAAHGNLFIRTNSKLYCIGK